MGSTRTLSRTQGVFRQLHHIFSLFLRYLTRVRTNVPH
jgi:hypothetical protein